MFVLQIIDSTQYWHTTGKPKVEYFEVYKNATFDEYLNKYFWIGRVGKLLPNWKWNVKFEYNFDWQKPLNSR